MEWNVGFFGGENSMRFIGEHMVRVFEWFDDVKICEKSNFGWGGGCFELDMRG